jgi:hypothetical protein
MLYQRQNDFAVRVSLELCFWTKRVAQGNMVVNFSVDGENDLSILANQGLRTRIFKAESETWNEAMWID